MTNEERITIMVDKLAARFPDKYVVLKTQQGKYPGDEICTTKCGLYVADIIGLADIKNIDCLESAFQTIMALDKA